MASFDSPKLSPETVQGLPGALIHLNGLHLESGGGEERGIAEPFLASRSGQDQAKA
jgi:hypothetical protein